MADLPVLFADGVPAYLAGELDEVTKSLMGSTQYKRISIRGSAFRMMVNGKEIAVSEDRSMNVIIVAAAPKTSRIFYEKTYSEGEALKPTCTSSDGDKPDRGVPKPQSASCQTCPHNIAGSGQNGTRACRYQRRLAVVLENDIDSGDVYQLVLPAKSIFGTGENGKMPLEQYAKFLGGHGVSILAVVTELRFDINADTPKLTFRAIRPLSEAEYKKVVALGRSADAVAAVSNDASALDNGEVALSSPYAQPVAEEAPKPKKPKPERVEPVPEPVKREAKKPVEEAPSDVLAVMSEWDDD
jgi:hypothetical protein